jgi:hypothetical protein
VANFYYEISILCEKEWGGRHFVKHSRSGDAMMAGGFAATMASDRIWKEENGDVRYIKHRYEDPANTVVDLKEFMWIKLKAENLV